MMLRRLLNGGSRPTLFAIGGGLSAALLTVVVGVAAFGGAGDDGEPSPTATPHRQVIRRTATPTRKPTPKPSPSATPTPEPAPIEDVQQQVEGPWSLPTNAPPPPPPPPPPPGPTPPPVVVPSNFIHPPPYKVFIDAGHGGREVGTSGGGWAEKNMNLDIALRLRSLLTAAGFQVVIDRTGDYSLTDLGDVGPIERRDEIQARVDMANQAGADILVSVHHNGSSVPSIRGTEIYYNPDRSYGSFNLALAQFTHSGLLHNIRAAGYDTVDRGIKNDGLVGGCPCNPHSWILGTNEGFRPSMMPGIIGEALFMTNAIDMSWLQQAGMRQAIAQGYRDGISAYFAWIRAQVPKPTPTPRPTPTPTPRPTATPTPSATPSPTPTPTPPETPTPTPVITPTPTVSTQRLTSFDRRVV